MHHLKTFRPSSQSHAPQIHANVVLSQDVLDYAPLFVEIADAYFEREMYADAKPIYEVLGADAAVSTLSDKLQRILTKGCE